MAKLRMSQRCSGKCGKYLIVGALVEKLHGHWWCPSCALEHKRGCAAHVLVDA